MALFISLWFVARHRPRRRTVESLLSAPLARRREWSISDSTVICCFYVYTIVELVFGLTLGLSETKSKQDVRNVKKVFRRYPVAVLFLFLYFWPQSLVFFYLRRKRVATKWKLRISEKGDMGSFLFFLRSVFNESHHISSSYVFRQHKTYKPVA